MRNLIYHVAVSIDGYIARADGSIDGFLMEGPHGDEYLEQLKSYDTVIMGRKTYEFGYAYGLKPGLAPYPHMRNFVVSSSLEFEGDFDQRLTIVYEDASGLVAELKEEGGSDIYLCGGGVLAGDLLKAGLIDKLVLKVNPVVFGSGIPLFQDVAEPVALELEASKTYDNGVFLNTYRLTQS